MMAKLQKKAWVLVADGEKALFMRNTAGAAHPELEIVRVESQENPRQGEQTADRPGRMPDSKGGQLSAMEEPDWHRLAKDRFAAGIAATLNREALKGAFEEIVLVAPPRTLGELRDQLHEAATARVCAEIPKTLTNHPLSEIKRRVLDALAEL